MLFLHNQLFCLETIGLCVKTSINQLIHNNMKKFTLLFLSLLAAFSVNASIAVCGIDPDDNGHFNCPYIKSGSIIWDETNRTLTLDNAVVEHSSETPYDYVYPIRVTENATIIIHGECKLTTTGFVALALDGYNSKSVTIQGDGTLNVSSRLRGIFLVCTRLTIKDITLQDAYGIMNNGDGVLCALTFDNVKADIQGGVYRIGEGITFKNCAITYPGDAYIAHDQYEDADYGYYIAYGDENFADHIIISRASGIKGDVNGDGEVNIADVNAVIDVILGSGSNTFADVNKDGEINIADVNVIIDIILGGGTPQDNHEYVDMGLPSGTLWATMNIGANTPEEYGSYFAWGETETKDNYNWSNNKWLNLIDGTYIVLTKYCTDSECGTVDGKTELDPEDDAAYVNWGPSWRMPTKEQFQELRSNCRRKWTTHNGVKGYLLTANNGNTLFFPAGGYRWGSMLESAGSYGYYWSRTLNSSDPVFAYCVSYSDFLMFQVDEHIRNYGLAVRPVRASN